MALLFTKKTIYGF